MKLKQEDRLGEQGFLDRPGECFLEGLQPPEIVGQVENPAFEAIRRLWWRALDRICYCFMLIRLSIHDWIYGPEPPTPADLIREANDERSPKPLVAVSETIPSHHIDLDRHGYRHDDRHGPIRTKIPRSEELILVGYFLARCGAGKDRTSPPTALGTMSWEEVYGMFYDRLGGGRGLRTFRYTLRLTRDSFDAYVDNRRKGWWQKPLTRLEKAVFDKWRLRDDQDIWKEVQSFLNR